MRTMKVIILLGLVASALHLSGCSLLMENEEDKPHQPVITDLSITPLVIHPGDAFTIQFSYRDGGADIEFGYARDKESNSRYKAEVKTDEATNTVIDPFPGFSGIFVGVVESFTAAQFGRHDIVVWVEDSEGTTSNVLQATITLSP